MARKFQKAPRIVYTAFDADGVVLGQVIAMNEHQGLERAKATYENADRVEQAVRGAEVAVQEQAS